MLKWLKRILTALVCVCIIAIFGAVCFYIGRELQYYEDHAKIALERTGLSSENIYTSLVLHTEIGGFMDAYVEKMFVVEGEEDREHLAREIAASEKWREEPISAARYKEYASNMLFGNFDAITLSDDIVFDAWYNRGDGSNPFAGAYYVGGVFELALFDYNTGLYIYIYKD